MDGQIGDSAVRRKVPEAKQVIPVSVVIAWVNPLELLEPCLKALEEQEGGCAQEVIVVTRHEKSQQERLLAAHPQVLLVSAPPATPITKLRSIGIRQAKGSAVAVTEDHCVPCSNWLRLIEQHMRQGAAVVGGPVENACTGRLRDWAAFLTEYAGAIGSANEGQSVTGTQHLPGNNIAYKRELTAGLCAVLDQGLWESFYHQTLTERGVELSYDSAMLVHHRRTFDFWYFVKQRYHFCRSFAGMRCKVSSAFDRLKYGCGSVLLPPFLLLRSLRTLLQKQRFLGLYIRCLPLIGTYMTVGALGEMIGYFTGGGDSLERVE